MSVESKIQSQIFNDQRTLQRGRFLDEMQDEAYAKSTLHGDAHVEWESQLPIHRVKAKRTSKIAKTKKPSLLSLNGEWLLKESETRKPVSLEKHRLYSEESEGVTKRWFEEGFDRSDWHRMHVPTTVQNALLKLGEIKDPFWNTNTWDELQQHGRPQDLVWHHRKTRIEQHDWWFARKFTLPKEWKGKKLRLYFDGVDYAGSFYLNGKPLGYHAGMFGGPEFDVTGLVRFDSPNEIVIRIDSVPDSWAGILKGSPGWGWHYGHLISMGIWRDVEIQVVPEVEVRNPFVKTQSINKRQAVIEIEYYILNSNQEPVTLDVTGTIKGQTLRSQALSFINRVTVPYGQTRYQTTLTIEKPKLWWPMNYGKQNIYQLQLTVSKTRSEKAIDSKRVAFGIRTIEMRPLPGSKEERDYRWQVVINGVPMFIKGANWCWTDPMLQLDPVKYEHFLELARRAGIQMFRCWGGGIIETDEFYRLCDQKGLMVYQEFPYCWGPPDFSMTNPVVLDQQVTHVVKRLRNHPSLVTWGGGNENWDILGADEALFLVGRRCRQYDPSRPFHRTSPWGGSIHNWDVYHRYQPIDSGFVNNPTPWYGEFGLPTMTSREETLKYLPEEKLNIWPPQEGDGAILSHLNQFTYRDFIKVLRYAGNYGPITNWDEYIEYSQMAQGDEICFATNLQRAGSYLNKGGLWFYKMSDLFPGQSWAVVGFYGHPKLSYYRAKQVFNPRAAFAHYEKFDWVPGEPFKASLHVNNDSLGPLENVRVKVIIYDSDLKEFWSKQCAVDSVTRSSRVDLDKIKVALNPEKMQPFLMAVSMRASDGRLISDQWYWLNYTDKTEAVRKIEKLDTWNMPKEQITEAFKAYAELPEARLLSLPQTQLSASLKRKGRAGNITIKNETALPAFNVIIDHFPYEYGSYLEDNSFCLYPYEERKVTFELTKANQSLAQLKVRAWNAPAIHPTTSYSFKIM